MTYQYKARPGAQLSDAQAKRYGPELQALSEIGGGEISAAGVLDAASSPKSPLHDFFQWDDTEAARQWRTMQARWMINSVEIVYIDSRGNERQTRAHQSVSYRDERTKHGRRKYHYIENQRVIEEEDAFEAVIDGYKRRINGLRRDMRQFEGLAEACRFLDEAEQELATAVAE